MSMQVKKKLDLNVSHLGLFFISLVFNIPSFSVLFPNKKILTYNDIKP